MSRIELTTIAWPPGDEELKQDIKEALEAEGYTFDGAGIKDFLADVLLGEDEDEASPGAKLGRTLAEQLNRFAAEHPELVQKAKSQSAVLAARLAARFLKP